MCWSCFRMLNILLPAYGRSYAALNRAGLLTATDEAENQELKNLVLRERAVVWADQEGSGNPLNTDKTGEEMHETGSTGLELAPVLSFSQLLYHSNSPCSKSSYCRLVFCINCLEVCYLDKRRNKPNTKSLQTTLFKLYTLLINSHFLWLQYTYNVWHVALKMNELIKNYKCLLCCK